MKYWPLLICVVATSVPLYAGLNGDKTLYVGGTVSGLKEQTVGTLSTKEEKEMVFQYKDGSLNIPYDHVDSLDYGRKAGRRVGMAVAVSPVFLLSKKRRHFLTLNYHDANGKEQAIVLELGKNIVRITLSSLEARTGRNVHYQDDESRNSSIGD